MILPFLTSVKSSGFYLYGTPLIYTQEVIDDNRPSRISIKKPNLTENNPFSIENLCDLIEDSYEEITLPKFSSVIPGTVDFEGFRERVRQGSFTYLHDNIEDDKLKDTMLERMPILKNVTQKNLIPVLDFEEYNSMTQRGSSVMSEAANGANVRINYLMVYLAGTLRSLSLESSSSALYTLPNLNNDEMQFHPFPVDRKLSYYELRNMIFQ